jgi:hypothetical protein
MRMIRATIIASLALLGAIISPAQGAGNDLPAVANLDIAKYSGLWYSVAEIHIPADQGYDLKCTRDRKVVYIHSTRRKILWIWLNPALSSHFITNFQSIFSHELITLDDSMQKLKMILQVNMNMVSLSSLILNKSSLLKMVNSRERI